MTPYKSNARFTFAAVKGGKDIATVDVFDTGDKLRSARRYFKRLGVDFDTIEFRKKDT